MMPMFNFFLAEPPAQMHELVILVAWEIHIAFGHVFACAADLCELVQVVRDFICVFAFFFFWCRFRLAP